MSQSKEQYSYLNLPKLAQVGAVGVTLATSGIISAAQHSGLALCIGAPIAWYAYKRTRGVDIDVRAIREKLQGFSLATGAQPKQVSHSPGMLDISQNYQPHVNDVLGHCILCVGQRGTGKSNVAARLIEQIGQYPIPMAIFDYKMDYVTLPTVLDRCLIAGSPDWAQKSTYQEAGYWDLDTENAFDAGYTILQNGVQMVFQVISYDTINAAAEVMLEIIKGMFAWAQKQQAGKRIPSLILLDEAQQFLPQNQGISQIDHELSMQLLSAFERLNSVGRSLGLTPAFFTQRVAQIKKEVIGGSEIFWLLKQSLSQDLKVYEDLLGKEHIDRRAIQAFEAGEALVYSYGEVQTTRFYERESEHLSVTPELQDALDFYRQRRFSTVLIPAPSRSPLGVPVSDMPKTPSSKRMPDLPMRESENAAVERREDRESAVNTHANSPIDSPPETPKFTLQDVAVVLNAFAVLTKSGEPVSRTKLMAWLHDNVSTSWNNKKWPLFQSVCDQYDICPKENK